MTPRFICHHSGPRGRQYGVPAALREIGALQYFYTDYCITAQTGSWVHTLLPALLRPRVVDDLLSRTLPAELPREYVRRLGLLEGWQVRRRSNRAVNALIREHIRADDFGGANAIWSMFNADLELLQEAKEWGFRVVHDQVLNPDVGRILHEERAGFPNVERRDVQRQVEEGIRRDCAQWALADRVLAPSAYTRDAIISLGGDPAKVRVVPYGIDPAWLAEKPDPAPGRVLFAGSVGLRKGVHYLAGAARLLKARGVNCEIRVVGPYAPEVVAHPEFEGPRYLGAIPRSRMHDEFLSADVFVHPSLAEGQAIAHLEALACGVPVVATPNAGSVVEDGVQGFTVPPRDAVALADRIEAIVTDRELRERMSIAAREHARSYTWTAYAGRLRTVLSELEDTETGQAACT